MTILIVEDEIPAARRLENMLRKLQPEAELLPVLDSVAATVAYLQNAPIPDLLFLDIQLADGQSFSIFEQMPLQCPIIFTTAYDQYALQAFKVNSIDYLLKPIDERDLQRALDQYNTYEKRPTPAPEQWQQLLNEIRKPSYKERFLIRSGEEIRFIQVDDIAYFYSEQGVVYARLSDRRKFHIDYTLEQLGDVLNPEAFFRVSRKFIVGLEAIERIFTYFNGRLKLEVSPSAPADVIVSRDRVSDFKQWIDR